ncbi:unnamed protein product [Sympodiomycopsis kandeliae]
MIRVDLFLTVLTLLLRRVSPEFTSRIFSLLYFGFLLYYPELVLLFVFDTRHRVFELCLYLLDKSMSDIDQREQSPPYEQLCPITESTVLSTRLAYVANLEKFARFEGCSTAQ